MRRVNRLHLIASMIVMSSLLLLAFSCGADDTPTPAAAPTAAPAPPAAPVVPVPTVVRPAPTTVPIPTPAGGPKYGGVLRQPLNLPATGHLDGHNFNEFLYRSTGYAIYNNLVKLTTDAEILPDLAERWAISDDGKSITFDLQRGVKFHDSTDFNAEVAKWSKFASDIGPSVESVVINDEYSVTVNLTSASRPFLANLTLQPGHVLSKQAVETLGEDFGRRPVGTGIFKLVEFVPGIKIEMTRNDDYWEPGLPYLDGASITGVPDDSVRLAMVRTAEAEIVVFVSPTDVPLVQDNPNLRVASGPGPTHVVVMNTQSPPFDNKALRQAIAYSFDRPEVIEAQFQGFGTPAQIPVIPADWAYDPNIRPYVRDLDKAKEKLSEAGYAGVEVPIFCMSTSAQIRMCEIFQAQFSEAGIKVKIERVLPSDYWSSWYSAYQGRRSTFGWWWWNWRPDPDIYLTRLYQTGGSWNVMDYSNPEVDRLLDQARAIYHTGDAKSLYSQILEIVMDDAPIVPFAYPDDFTVMTNKLGGFNWRADPGIRIREYWLEQ